MEVPCHICESLTEFTCDQCKQPVCEDCCVQMTIHNQIDYPLCTDCHDINKANDWDERSREWAKQAVVDKKKAEASLKLKANYWKPENIEKRRAAKAKRKADKVERDRAMIKEAAKFISEAFRGMF